MTAPDTVTYGPRRGQYLGPTVRYDAWVNEWERLKPAMRDHLPGYSDFMVTDSPIPGEIGTVISVRNDLLILEVSDD